MNITIRRATIEDLPAISDLSQELFIHERQFTDEYDMTWSHAKAGQDFFTKQLKRRRSYILLALDDDKPVGYILIKIEKFTWRAYNPIAEVGNFSVHPAYRGKGIGTMLFEQSKAIAKKRGVKRLSVQALANNFRAVKFYRARGFEDFDLTMLMKID